MVVEGAPIAPILYSVLWEKCKISVGCNLSLDIVLVVRDITTNGIDVTA